MRTTLTIDDDLTGALKEKAFRTGKTFKAVVNDALRTGLAQGDSPPRSKRYRVESARLGGLAPGRNLDKSLALADSLEDREIARKLELRK